jgi:alkylation response protein AidB-like acyl-CoA dehydrogenase
LRDARVNQIAEGANEVLKSFIALVGMRAPGLQFQELQEVLRHPWGEWRKMWLLGIDRMDAAVRPPAVPVQNPLLRPFALRLGRCIRRFNLEVDRALIRHREEILERQYVQERLASVAMELFASACVLSRWDAEFGSSSGKAGANGAAQSVADLFLRGSFRRIEQALAELHDNDDMATTATADWVMRNDARQNE